VSGDGVQVDYAGTSPASRHGINSPKCYTDAYTSYGVKCIVAPEIPNNAGSLSAIRVSAPDDTIVSALRPRPVTARHVIGQMLPELVFNCFAEPLADRVPAEGAGSMWVMGMSGGPLLAGASAGATPFNVISIGIGGMGARPEKDGISSTAFPSGVGAIPVEVTESQSPLLFRRRELAQGSGGEGRHRGGMGAVIEIENLESEPFSIACATVERRHNPARGRAGGGNGREARVTLASGKVLPGKETYVIPPGDRLVVEMPGGGGYGKSHPVCGRRDRYDGRMSAEGNAAAPPDRARWRRWAAAVQRETLALYFAARDPRTPWYAKLLAAAVAAYAVSPIDLIPDFIPVIGYLDDALLLPLGVWLTLKLLPEAVIADARARAAATLEQPASRAAAFAIVLVWVAGTAALLALAIQFL